MTSDIGVFSGDIEKTEPTADSCSAIDDRTRRAVAVSAVIAPSEPLFDVVPEQVIVPAPLPEDAHALAAAIAATKAL
jgi:hypothetical protein